MESNSSLWSRTAEMPAFGPLGANLDVDVAIVGGGVTGLTAAMLLAEAGRRVVVVEARRLGSGVSNRSTAQLTEAIDTRYLKLESTFGKEGAKLAGASSRAAIEKVRELVDANRIECGFVRCSGYLFTESDDDVAALHEEHDAARRAGLPVELLPRAPVPFETKCALHFPDQAQLHVARYLAGLAIGSSARGAILAEESRVIAIEDGEPCLVHLEHGHVVRARHVFLATHSPLNRVFLQTKIAAYRSYVVAFRDVASADGLFWDTEHPYHYLSSYVLDGTSWLLVGGEDHKTGTEPKTEERLDALYHWTKQRIAVPAPSHRWSAQVEEPVDGLPYIGRSGSEHVVSATGFSGNGMTFGTIAAMIVRDVVLGRKSPWAALFAARRVKPIASAGAYASENVDFPIHLVSDRLAPPDAKQLSEIAAGEGKTVRVRGERLAVYRDPKGNLHALSSVCTHLGCLVKWNGAEKTWDCPCHGSRFGIDGTVLDGPATRALSRPAIDANGERGAKVRHQSGFVREVAADARNDGDEPKEARRARST